MKKTKVSAILGGGGMKRKSRFSIRLGQLMKAGQKKAAEKKEKEGKK